MKYIYYILFFLIAFEINAQVQDTAQVKLEIDSLIKVCRTLTGQQKFEEAIQVITIGKVLAESFFGENSTIYAKCIFNQGRIYWFMNRYMDAEPFYLCALNIQKQILGKENSDYAQTLNNLGHLYLIIERYDLAEPIFLDLKRIRFKLVGQEHVDYANSLYNLGVLYLETNRYNNAELLLLEAKIIHAKGYGLEHPIYASTLRMIGRLYIEKGQYNLAELMLIESKTIFKKAFGNENIDYVCSLSYLANLYRLMNRFDSAESFYLEVLAIVEKVEGKNSLDYLSNINNLADLYRSMGIFNRAEALFLELNIILEDTAFSNFNGSYRTNLINLALLYYNMENYKLSEELFSKVKTIFESTLVKKNSQYSNLLNDYSLLKIQTGDYINAEKFLMESKEITATEFGMDHPNYGLSLQILGELHYLLGNYNAAEELLKMAEANYAKAFGGVNLNISYNLNSLSSLYEKLDQLQNADTMNEKLFLINQKMLMESVSFLSESEIANYTKHFKIMSNRLLNTIYLRSLRHFKQDKIVKTVFDEALFNKGFLFNNLQQIDLLTTSNTEAFQIKNNIKAIQIQLSKQFASPITERDTSLIVKLERKANALEKELARTVSGYSDAKAEIKWKDIQSILNEHDAAIEFVHFIYTNPNPTDSVIYSALIVMPGDTTPQYITLFEEKELKKLLDNSNVRKKEFVANLYQSSTDLQKQTDSSKNKSLYELIWMPLGSKLAGVKTIYFSPSGLLHQINQNAVSIDDKSLLSDKYKLVQLSSTRELVFGNKETGSQPKSACLIGGVNFDMDSTEMIAAHQMMDSNSIALRSELSFSYTDTSLRGGSFKYLTGSEKEIKDIQQIFNKANINATSYHGNNATEEAFKKLGDYNSTSPQIIHISTHGFFFPDPKSSHQAAVVSHQVEPVFKISEHPMIRSGLLLAGANQTWKTGKPLRPDMEDGILTAYEISQLNLRNTELIVLSACETGLGEIQGNEGVYGLQRAFKIAGAKNLIMSLWQVPDKETGELMTLFYKNWLIKKMSIRESLIEAQNVLRDIGLTPFYWAGFVLVE